MNFPSPEMHADWKSWAAAVLGELENRSVVNEGIPVVYGLPPAGPMFRGKVVFLLSAAAADHLYVCRYNGVDFEWTEIV